MTRSTGSDPANGRMCPNGHPVRNEDVFCSVCGVVLEDATVPPDQAGASETPGTNSGDPAAVAPASPVWNRKWIWLAAGIIIVMASLLAVLLVTRSSGTEDKSSSQPPPPSSSAVPTATQQCITNTSDWMTFITENTDGLTLWGREVGSQSPVYQGMFDLYRSYISDRTLHGRATADQNLSNQIATKCSGWVSKNYTVPPQPY